MTQGPKFRATEFEPGDPWIRARGSFERAVDGFGPEIEIEIPITSVAYIEKVGASND
jgi:hypothetical protein